MNFKFNFFLYLFNSESVKVYNFSPNFVVCYFVIFMFRLCGNYNN